MAPWLGHKAALQILGNAEGETAYSRGRLERRWWYRGYPWFLPIADIGFRLKDAAASLRNRRQERRQAPLPAGRSADAGSGLRLPAIGDMVVHNADRLQERINDCRAHEVHSPQLQLPGDQIA